ncbi:MAG: hypothetical protein EAZ95_03885 [Bacteroidetes bacterium]|nr:MAG: hypothetical protein EAZ95_03885 [Bacteroidota bacterium]
MNLFFCKGNNFSVGLYLKTFQDMVTKQQVGLGFFTFAFVGLGITHFYMPAFFVEMMPPFLPMREVANLLAGASELVLGIALWTKYRNQAIYVAIAMLVVFGLAIHGWHLWIGKFPPLPTASVSFLWVRFLMQFVLIYALWNLRDKKN